jgi:protein phosphatase
MAQIDFFQLSDAGNAHAENEDAVAGWPQADGLVFAVADGIGDEGGGRLASSLAVEVFGRELAEGPSDLPLLTRLRRGVQAANFAIYQKAVTVPELRYMGTTFTVTAVAGGSLLAAHVGDCRLWLLRDKKLTQLTKDHTWVWAHLPGTGTQEERHTHPRRYSLPRCLGHELVVSIDMLSLELRSWDVLLQCSDGVYRALAESELQALLEAHPSEAACRAILRRAREEDGRDDLSVQVVGIVDVPEPPARSWWRFGR